MKKTLLLLAAAVLALCTTIPSQAKSGIYPQCMPGEKCSGISLR